MTEQKVVAKRRRRSWRKTRTGMILERLGQNKLAMIGLIIIALLAFMAIFAPVIAPYSPTYQDFSAIYCKPNGEHWFGCDALGRDIFSRCVYGARYSLSLGLAATVFGSAIGLFFGVIVGYIGGRTDTCSVFEGTADGVYRGFCFRQLSEAENYVLPYAAQYYFSFDRRYDYGDWFYDYGRGRPFLYRTGHPAANR